jgi:translation initiation factor eIF-2B subunit gamma
MLTQTSGTAEILRLPEVENVITGDFMVLPCDLICEVGGESLLEAWMVEHAGLGGVAAGRLDYSGPCMARGGEKGGRRGGLGVWFQTKGEGSVKGEETDFVITAQLEPPVVPPPGGSLRPHISKLVYSTTTDTLKDIVHERKNFPIRHGLIRNNGRVRILTTYRDAHVYLFPYWVLEYVKKNESMDSISEDLVGWWAKAGWQDGLGEKMGLREVFDGIDDKGGDHGSHHSGLLEDEMDIESMSTTRLNTAKRILSTVESRSRLNAKLVEKPNLVVPPILAYIHPSEADTPFIRRVDTAALLLSVSLRLAKLESIDEVGRSAASPFSHAFKIAHQSGIAQRCTVTKSDCLLAENVKVEEKSVIKETVIGANCQIKSGARLTRCVLMDGVIVGERCQLTGCILGRRCQIGKESILKECEVQQGNAVPEETDAKGEKFMVFEGLDGEDDGELADDSYGASDVDMDTLGLTADR